MSRRVLYLNHTSQMSGGEHSLMLLLGGLPDEVLPILACPEGSLEQAGKAAAVPWVPVRGTAGSLKLHPVYTPAAVRDLMRAALEVRQAGDELSIDLIHANSIRAGLVAALAHRIGGPPLLAHIRDVLPPGAMSTMTTRLLAAEADIVVANSEYTRRHLPLRGGGARTTVVHNPVDLDRFDSDQVDATAVRRELGLGEGARLLAVVAQITPWKGQDTAIRTLAGLRERGHDAHLALAGSAKFVDKATRFNNEAYRRELHELSAGLGVEDHVSFLGERGDVPAIMAASEALLMPSWQEPFGRAVIEAMAVGTAVLATDVGGTTEIVSDGVDGLLLAPEDPDPWIAALDRLLADRAHRDRLAAAGHARAAAFSVANHVGALLEIYSEIVPVGGAVMV
ncbi:MAG TPA: glycosyltransferase family 4 protein [Solirubrobacterales bacterium]|nr:glycosyltransferase family 4 protein [Solirubrobacterales bacterium]